MRLGGGQPSFFFRKWRCDSSWHVVVCAPMEHAPRFRLLHCSPLVEEERNALLQADAVYAFYPLRLHVAGTRAALAAHDHPMDAVNIKLPKIFQVGFD